jgi:putative endonuclease
MDKKVFGNIGENVAVKFLKDKKYQILAQNYKNKIGEIDIIAKEKDTIVFIEVKSRESTKFGMPREAVTGYKQNKIRTVALSYLQQKKMLNAQIRFDVIEYLDGKITHIENCF